MKEKLLDKLACPKCRDKLKLTKQKTKDNKITEGTLTCSKCKQKYPIKQGIPNLLPKTKNKK
ncbi:Protein Trm112 family [Methanonatronarchaeum thermophilum]|uniref:Protein Trm112 family n=1 Tax=Methanonatronarchaeum thermophilum TaxID=1927129 RepID=A0A1Y3GCQ8_9EURY|nr:methytransferase partner Trm112 [Methanonatronarchaeum thermophilum]OUJ19242.1 Protein Trm112 family [Methanonatronarchaeum thermophilum]